MCTISMIIVRRRRKETGFDINDLNDKEIRNDLNSRILFDSIII